VDPYIGVVPSKGDSLRSHIVTKFPADGSQQSDKIGFGPSENSERGDFASALAHSFVIPLLVSLFLSCFFKPREGDV
jgi:hypothetical protein